MNETTTAISGADSPTSNDDLPDDYGVSSFASRPILRLLDDGRVAPMAEIFLYGTTDGLLLQRQLTAFELTSVAESLINASVGLLSSCQDQIQPRKGWAVSIIDVENDIANIRKALEQLQAQLRTLAVAPP